MIASVADLPLEWTRMAPPPRPLAAGDRWNVFLSYRSVNRAWALSLYDLLRQQGHSVFIDQFALKPGEGLARQLHDALHRSQSGVLIWPTSRSDSEWVQFEYGTLERLALEKRGFQFILIRLESITTLPLFAQGRLIFDFSAYPDGPNGGELLRLLYALVDEPLSREAARFALDLDETAREAAAKIAAAVRNKYPKRLIQLYEEGGLVWKISSALACKTAEGLTRLGHIEDALMLLESIRERFPKAIRPKQLLALALARRGSEEDLMMAQEILGGLYISGERDPETLGIYGRTWMDRFARSGDLTDLQQSRDLYAEAFESAPDDYYTGINAASKSVMLGYPEDLAKGAGYAQLVQRITGSEPRPGDYWMTATVGESFLIQKNYRAAARLYSAAVSMARAEIASHESTWRQACRLMNKLQPTAGERSLIRDAFAHLPDCQ
jgi:TIR domain/MAP3K TRAFs-binding domain